MLVYLIYPSIYPVIFSLFIPSFRQGAMLATPLFLIAGLTMGIVLSTMSTEWYLHTSLLLIDSYNLVLKPHSIITKVLLVLECDLRAIV
jgi:hypothetical protein